MLTLQLMRNDQSAVSRRVDAIGTQGNRRPLDSLIQLTRRERGKASMRVVVISQRIERRQGNRPLCCLHRDLTTITPRFERAPVEPGQ